MKLDPRQGARLHEYAVTESILQIVQAELEKSGAARVDGIKVVIGELTSFVGESIEFYFGEMARGTAAQDAAFSFQRMEAKAVCDGCSTVFRPRHALFVCPECGSGAFNLKEGNELYIESIEVS